MAGSSATSRAQRAARRIQDFETETILRRLKEQGVIHKADGAHGPRHGRAGAALLGARGYPGRRTQGARYLGRGGVLG